MLSRQEGKSCQGDLLMTHTRRSRGDVRESSPRARTHLCLQLQGDVDNTSLITCFDAVAAFGQAPETELIFIDAPARRRAKVGQHVLWQCLNVREGRRKRARAWLDHFVDTLLSKECLGTFKQVPDNLLFERVRCCIGPACRKGGVRTSRD